MKLGNSGRIGRFGEVALGVTQAAYGVATAPVVVASDMLRNKADKLGVPILPDIADKAESALKSLDETVENAVDTAKDRVQKFDRRIHVARHGVRDPRDPNPNNVLNGSLQTRLAVLVGLRDVDDVIARELRWKDFLNKERSA